MANTIGIDFGTTKTMVSYFNPASGRVELVRLGRDRDSIPTTVYVDNSGSLLFGDDADDMIETDPEGYVRAFKLELGNNEPLVRGNLSAEKLAAEFLKHIKRECEQSVFHGKVEGATITTPVSFSPARKAALKRAAQVAGFSSVAFLSEPEAAGTAFLRDNPNEKFSRALILDWGGGTVDISILEKRQDGTIHADGRCAEGRDDMGGEEIDRGLLDSIAALLGTADGVRDEMAEVRFLREAKELKERLSKKESVSFRRGTKKQDFTREQFNHIIRLLLEEAVRLVSSALAKNAEQGKPEPDALILIGGSCQIPAVRETMEKNFPKLRVLSWHHSHEAVALGASSCPKAAVMISGPLSDSSRQLVAVSAPSVNTVNEAMAIAKRIADVNQDISALGKKEADVISRAAMDGNSRAAGFLAAIYHDGCEGYAKNYEESYRWAERAANAGDSRGQVLLAAYYCGLEEQSPVKKDIMIARKWAKKAHAQGGEYAIQNACFLMVVLSLSDVPDVLWMQRLGNEVLQKVGNYPPEHFLPGDRLTIGVVCWLMANLMVDCKPDAALEVLQKGAEFENENCIEMLSAIMEDENSADAEDENIKDTDIVFDCPHCGQSMYIDCECVGQEISCTKCGRAVIVPRPVDDSWGVGTGAAVGAAIGTVIPGIGTVLGAGIGAGIGWLKKNL